MRRCDLGVAVLGFAFAAAAVAAAVAVPSDARAADGDGGVAVRDPGERIEIVLPPNPARMEPRAGEAATLAVWGVDLDGDRRAWEFVVIVQERPQFARAALAGSTDWGYGLGTVLPESVVAGEGSWSETRQYDAGRVMVRLVETEGMVYAAAIQMSEKVLEKYADRARAILGSFRGLSGFQMRTLPDGMVRIPFKNCEVWTDAPKAKIERLVREFDVSCATARKLLPGGSLMPGPLRLIAFSQQGDFEAFCTEPGGSPPPLPLHDALDRAVALDLARRGVAGYDTALRRAAGALVSAHHFGGLAPPWFHYGVGVHTQVAVALDGKLDGLVPEIASRAKTYALAANAPLAKRLEVLRDPVPEFDGFVCDAYAWHHFFRFGVGEKRYGERYRKCLETLRRTGDVRESVAAWDGVDQAKLHRDFQDWLPKWK